MADFRRALEERRDELLNRLESNRLFQEYQLVLRLLEKQAEDQAGERLTVTPERKERAAEARRVGVVTSTGVKAVQDAAEGYLRGKGGERAPSGEIHRELVRLGLLQDTASDRGKVTSYLGRDKVRFDNVQGRGYGLRR